jgi:hypothetical protein
MQTYILSYGTVIIDDNLSVDSTTTYDNIIFQVGSKKDLIKCLINNSENSKVSTFLKYLCMDLADCDTSKCNALQLNIIYEFEKFSDDNDIDSLSIDNIMNDIIIELLGNHKTNYVYTNLKSCRVCNNIYIWTDIKELSADDILHN